MPGGDLGTRAPAVERDVPWSGRMARTYRELVVWQMGDKLRREVYRAIAVAGRKVDLRLRSQLSDAVSSVTGNIAEGFGRKSHADFARFIVYSFSSLDETTCRLEDGLIQGCWSADEISEAFRLRTPAARRPRQLSAVPGRRLIPRTPVPHPRPAPPSRTSVPHPRLAPPYVRFPHAEASRETRIPL